MRPFLAFAPLSLLSMVAIAQNASPPHSDVQTNWQSINQLGGQLELSTPKQMRIVVDGKSDVRLYTAFLEGATLTLEDARAGPGDPPPSFQKKKTGLVGPVSRASSWDAVTWQLGAAGGKERLVWLWPVSSFSNCACLASANFKKAANANGSVQSLCQYAHQANI